MKLYHGTSAKNIPSIKKLGLVPTLGLFSPSKKAKDIKAIEALNSLLGKVYFTEDKNICRLFVPANEKLVILSVDSKSLRKKYLDTYREPMCDILNISDFYNYSKVVPFNLLTIEK